MVHVERSALHDGRSTVVAYKVAALLIATRYNNNLITTLVVTKAKTTKLDRSFHKTKTLQVVHTITMARNVLHVTLVSSTR